MKNEKLNENWSAALDSPSPVVLDVQDGIGLSFYLNSLVFDHIEEGTRGSIEFYQVHKYYFGDLSEEGSVYNLFKNDSKEFPAGEFYEVKDSDWKENFPHTEWVLNENVDNVELKHFVGRFP